MQFDSTHKSLEIPGRFNIYELSVTFSFEAMREVTSMVCPMFNTSRKDNQR